MVKRLSKLKKKKEGPGRNYQGRKDFQDGELCEVTTETEFIDQM